MASRPGKTVGVYERPPKSRRTLYLAIAIAVLLMLAGLFFFSQPASAASTAQADGSGHVDRALGHVST
jgi:hypothetical protein